VPKSRRELRPDWLLQRDFISDVEHFFYITEAQGEAKIQPNAMTDDLGREAMTMIKRVGGAHQCVMPMPSLISSIAS
jgi:hypothetical protein